jgi:hypothetical protein
VLANLPSEGHDYRHLTRPQHTILYDEQGRLVVDYLIRFESLQQDFDRVCDLIGKPRRVHQSGVQQEVRLLAENCFLEFR